MAQYLISIKTAIVLFPILAILFTIPYKIYHSHRKSPITLQKSIVLYSFMFYLLCTYCLIILPLPTISEVAGYTSPTKQLIPFQFLNDFIRETTFRPAQPNTWITALKENCFLQVIFNIFLFIPLGIYLKHYFRLTLPQILLLSFTLSLFLELTQLSGLYGIYPRGYRLFDLDDLILNTTGGILGSKIVHPLTKLYLLISNATHPIKNPSLNNSYKRTIPQKRTL